MPRLLPRSHLSLDPGLQVRSDSPDLRTRLSVKLRTEARSSERQSRYLWRHQLERLNPGRLPDSVGHANRFPRMEPLPLNRPTLRATKAALFLGITDNRWPTFDKAAQAPTGCSLAAPSATSPTTSTCGSKNSRKFQASGDRSAPASIAFCGRVRQAEGSGTAPDAA